MLLFQSSQELCSVAANEIAHTTAESCGRNKVPKVFKCKGCGFMHLSCLIDPRKKNQTPNIEHLQCCVDFA